MGTSLALIQKAGALEESDDLIARAQSGDHAAFEAIYKRHLSRVYAICLRILRDRGRAEEVTQRIFIRAWLKLSSFRGESQFSSWLYRLSINVILAQMTLSSAADERSAEGTEIQPVAVCSAEPVRILRLDLDRAIDALPPQARVIFILHDIEGFTHEEIGAAMELAPGTSKAQLSRARKLLREALKR
jgi:RNA polymerase sigma-70 factor (ECF subfamily)